MVRSCRLIHRLKLAANLAPKNHQLLIHGLILIHPLINLGTTYWLLTGYEPEHKSLLVDMRFVAVRPMRNHRLQSQRFVLAVATLIPFLEHVDKENEC